MKERQQAQRIFVTSPNEVDIDWFLRYGEGETPEVARFLGYNEETTMNNKVTPADIRDLIDCDREVARGLAAKCNVIGVNRKVHVWELSLEGIGTARVLYFDGWDTNGHEVSHARVWAM